MRFHRVSLFAATLLLVSAPVIAQVRGELKGRIADPSGAAVPSAAITLTQESTGITQSTTTTAEGLYDFPQLNSDSYAIRVTRAGFGSVERRGVTVTVGSTTGLDLALNLEGVSQTVTVTADAPLLQSQTSNIQTTISANAMQALPLNSRNFIQLAQLAPGVALPPGTLLPRINGGRPRTNEYLFDGISALQPEPGQVAFFPILDDAEFTVQANNVPAEFGRFNGGVVNVATRSGSNGFHGSVFEYFRNESLNAKNFFTAANTRKPQYRRNLFGATLGTALLRDKLFAFADYQGVKQRIGVTRISTVPTAAQRSGVFTGVSKIYDPNTTTTVGGRLTRTEFPSDVINTPLDPAAVALLARYPLPNLPGAANNYTRVATDDDHQNQFDIRVDGARSTRDRAFVRYSYFHDVEQPATPLPDGSGAITGSVINAGNVAGLTHITGQQIVLSETHTFASRFINDARLGYTRRGNTQAGTLLSNGASSALGIPGIPTNAAFSNALPLFTLTGFTQLGPAASTFSRYQTAVGQLVDTVLWTHAAHTFKVGIDARRYELNAIAPPNPTGSFAFTATGTNTTTAAPAAAASTGGNALASFLLGQVDTFSIDLQSRTIRPRDYIYEFFAEDDWRALPNLTINAGVRYTLHLPSTETRNQGAVFNTGTQQLDYLGVNGFPRTARTLHYGNFAPRFGLALSVDPKTVIRSGFGIIFIDQSGITTPFTTPQYPFIQNVQQKTTDSYTAAFRLSTGPSVAPIALTPDAGLGQSVYTANRSAGSGYVEQWNLAVQRSITSNLSAEVAYVGSHIVHVGIPDSNLNQLTAAQLAQGSSLTTQVANPYFGILPASSPIGTKTVAAAQLLKPFPRFQNVATYRNNTGTTNYNAFQVKVEQRLSRSLSLLFGYTHSKLIDDASSVFSSTVLSSPNSSSLIAADTFRPYLERDSSNGDITNITTVAAVYALPKFRGHGLATAALVGWQLDTIVTLQSGMPVTVTQATNTNSFAGIALMRPMRVADPKLPSDQRTAAHWFNTASFTTTPQFAFGNASRNPVRGPAYRSTDVSLIKHTALGEHTDLEFRAELFNISNTPGFAQPSGSFGTAAFGTITATVTDPRVAQFALRLTR